MMKTKAPLWAQKLTHEVIEEEKKINPKAFEPYIHWVKLSKPTYHGTSGGLTIDVRVGKIPRWMQKMVVLHELAHHVLPRYEQHSKVFWAKAFTFYRRYGLPIKKVLAYEGNYKRRAKNGYKLARRISRQELGN